MNALVLIVRMLLAAPPIFIALIAGSIGSIFMGCAKFFIWMAIVLLDPGEEMRKKYMPVETGSEIDV